MSHLVGTYVSELFPTPAEEAWEALTRSDITKVSQSFGPIPGVVAVHDEPAGFFDEPGHSRVLENSDGSTVCETIEAIDPGRSLDYTLTDLTNVFRYVTTGAKARFEFESVGDGRTRVTWRYAWQARNVVSLPLVWLITWLAFRPYMRRMLRRIREGAV